MFGGFPKHFFIRVRGARIFLKGNARRVRAQVGAVSFFILESWLIRLPGYGVVHTRKVKKIWQKNLKKSRKKYRKISGKYSKNRKNIKKSRKSQKITKNLKNHENLKKSTNLSQDLSDQAT